MKPGEFERFINGITPKNSHERVTFVFGWVILGLPLLDQIFFKPFGVLTVVFSVLYTVWMIVGILLFTKKIREVQ